MSEISGFSSQLRYTGLSGFDTESIVTQLMDAEKIPLTKLYQRRTLVEWKQEAYRDISSSLAGFKSKFFDIVNRSTYLLAESAINAMKAESSDNSYLSVTANSSALAGSQTVKVIQLATADRTASSARVSSDITGTVSSLALSGKKISVTLDGLTKEITLENYTDYADMDTKLQTSLNNAFGASKIDVQIDSAGALIIGTQSGATTVTVNKPASGESGLTGLGVTAGESNRISLSSTLASLQSSLSTPFTFSGTGTLSFTINGKTITANSTDTLDQVFQKINNDADANVQISYNEITDKITLTSKQTGTGDNLVLSESETNFFAALKLSTDPASITQGVDAKITINGTETLVRSTNIFTANGITYTLNKAHDTADTGETITVAQDTDSVVSNIKTFVEEYNKLIESINDKVSESYDRDYQPLTDEQKEDMEAADIEKWEEKAKTGILRNDSVLEKITLSMRQAIYSKVKDAGLSLNDIGLETGSWQEEGKLYLDEEKLKNALLTNPDGVTKLLSGVSAENPAYTRTLTTDQRKDRYEKSGIFQRISDIIEDNISTSRDSYGNKGILLEKAGIEDDSSNYDNLMYEELRVYDNKINDMLERLEDKEEDYYKRFSNLESMLNKMNQQSAWLTSQFNGG
jgi:flagellar hook-associated protein 2